MPSADSLIVKWFYQMGKLSSDGMSLKGFSFSELKAFNDLYQLDLDPWESEQLIMMSRTYAFTLTEAKDPTMSAPWHDKEFSDLEHARAKVFRNGKNLAKIINQSKKQS